MEYLFIMVNKIISFSFSICTESFIDVVFTVTLFDVNHIDATIDRPDRQCMTWNELCVSVFEKKIV